MDVGELNALIYRIEGLISRNVTDYRPVDGQEILAYFDGPAPSGDETTVEDVVDNQWLLIHELIEISELKKMGLEISSSLLSTHPLKVEQAHLKASRDELHIALNTNDTDWIQSRLHNVKAWSEDRSLPADLRNAYSDLYYEFS